MSHHDNVRFLPHRSVSQPRRHGGLARVIPLHPHPSDSRVWRMFGVALFAVGVTLLITAALMVALRTGNDLLGAIAPGWPWW